MASSRSALLQVRLCTMLVVRFCARGKCTRNRTKALTNVADVVVAVVVDRSEFELTLRSTTTTTKKRGPVRWRGLRHCNGRHRARRSRSRGCHRRRPTAQPFKWPNQLILFLVALGLANRCCELLFEPNCELSRAALSRTKRNGTYLNNLYLWLCRAST